MPDIYALTLARTHYINYNQEFTRLVSIIIVANCNIPFERKSAWYSRNVSDKSAASFCYILRWNRCGDAGNCKQHQDRSYLVERQKKTLSIIARQRVQFKNELINSKLPHICFVWIERVMIPDMRAYMQWFCSTAGVYNVFSHIWFGKSITITAYY